jgi:WD40-like Beta Propeller Repeat
MKMTDSAGKRTPTSRSDGRSRLPFIIAAIVAVLAVGGMVWMAISQRDTAPAAQASPTTEPTLAPSPTEEPSATPTPTPVEPPIVALTSAGDLVLLDPATGATQRTIASDPSWTGPITVDPNREYAYVGAEDFSPGTTDPETIDRVSLSDGSAEDLLAGYGPAISPDGRTLAYSAPGTDLSKQSQGVYLLDLETGDNPYLLAEECTECSFGIDQPAWSPDGSRLFASMGMHDSPYPAEYLLAVNVSTATSFADAQDLTPPDDQPEDPALPGVGWSDPTSLADGGLAVYVTQCEAECADDMIAPLSHAYIRVLDPTSGEVRERIDMSGMQVIDLAASPTGTGLSIVVAAATDGPFQLYRWDSGTGLRPLAEGIVAVG